MSTDSGDFDDVVLVPQIALGAATPIDVLHHAVALVGKLAAEDGKSPLTVRLMDADERCLVTITMTLEDGRWKGQVENGEIESREGLAFPWFLVLENSDGRTRRIRLELDAQARPN